MFETPLNLLSTNGVCIHKEVPARFAPGTSFSSRKTLNIRRRFAVRICANNNFARRAEHATLGQSPQSLRPFMSSYVIAI